MKFESTHPGDPIRPEGNPMTAGMGPGAWADRADRPDLTLHGDPRIVPLRVAEGYQLDARDPDPRGMTVVGADGVPAGVVVDVWVDRAEPQPRYLEVELSDGERRVLLPLPFAKLDRKRGRATVRAILGHQFADVPSTRAPDRITLLEEDRVAAYYAGGYLYAEPSRQEPLL